MKGKPASKAKRQLRQPIPELAEAAAAKTPKPWEPKWAHLERDARLAAKRERERNMPMPAHQPKKPRVLYYGMGVPHRETREEFEARKRRLATRRAGRKYI